ncbi:MAG: hypothetical protein AAB426_12715, partial [Myxococcota bacterium]
AATLVVRGESVRERRGVPVVVTEARLRNGRGIERLMVRAGTREIVAERIDKQSLAATQIQEVQP